MLTKICPHCSRTYRIEDVRVDENWNRGSFDGTYCHCPYCDTVLPNVFPDAVDLAKHLKSKYILAFVSCFVLASLGVATNILEYVGPILLGIFGVWLTKTAHIKDHRIIGWLLVVISLVVFLAVRHTA